VSVKKQRYCSGCRDDWYNHNGPKRCWSLDSARVVRRWRLDWWTQPLSVSVFQAVTTLDCHHAPGHYAHSERLPQHLGGGLPPKEAKL